MIYQYGMRLRGYSPGAQPKDGLVTAKGDPAGKYYNILVYDRELTEKEVDGYDLDRLYKCWIMAENTETGQTRKLEYLRTPKRDIVRPIALKYSRDVCEGRAGKYYYYMEEVQE